jgi:hypothetical protein
MQTQIHFVAISAPLKSPGVFFEVTIGKDREASFGCGSLRCTRMATSGHFTPEIIGAGARVA